MCALKKNSYKNVRIFKQVIQKGGKLSLQISHKPLIGLYYEESSPDIILEEILVTEGLPYLRLYSLEKIDRFSVIILGTIKVKSHEIHFLERFFQNKGVLLTVQPQGLLLDYLEIENTGQTQTDGYLNIQMDK